MCVDLIMKTGNRGNPFHKVISSLTVQVCVRGSKMTGKNKKPGERKETVNICRLLGV